MKPFALAARSRKVSTLAIAVTSSEPSCAAGRPGAAVT
jgi:hypothetical protein